MNKTDCRILPHSLATDLSHSRGAERSFAAALDAPQSGGRYLANEFAWSAQDANPLNPFNIWRKKYGQQTLKALWQGAFSSPYKQGERPFMGILDGGLCSGFAAMAAHTFDRARGGGAPMNQQGQNIANIVAAMVPTQLRILSNDILCHFKYFMLHMSDSFATLPEYVAKPGTESSIVTFIPQLAWDNVVNLEQKLEYTHSLVLKRCEMRPDGVMKVSVWDPNVPRDDSRTLLMNSAGAFTYITEFDGPCTVTSDPGSTFKSVGARQIPTRLGDMIAAPLPVHLLCASRPSYFDAAHLIAC